MSDTGAKLAPFLQIFSLLDKCDSTPPRYNVTVGAATQTCNKNDGSDLGLMGKTGPLLPVVTYNNILSVQLIVVLHMHLFIWFFKMFLKEIRPESNIHFNIHAQSWGT